MSVQLKKEKEKSEVFSESVWQVHPHYFDVISRSVLCVGLHHANPIEDAHAMAHTAEDGVLPIQPLSWAQGQEELAAIGVRTCICHGQDTSTLSKSEYQRICS